MGAIVYEVSLVFLQRYLLENVHISDCFNQIRNVHVIINVLKSSVQLSHRLLCLLSRAAEAHVRRYITRKPKLQLSNDSKVLEQ